jgi:hypothetical protein
MDAPTELCIIMGNNKSDKGSQNITRSWHNYTLVYNNLFKDRRNESLRVFELGLGTNNVNLPSNMGVNGRPGASLYGWSEYFPNATIFGADIDSNCLFQTDRIKTYYCDQTNPHVIGYMWKEDALNEPFDIIIEDGLHTYEANVCFFENSIHKLASKGIYVIEDIANKDIPRFEQKISEWKLKYTNLTFDLMRLPSYVNKVDNNLLVVTST